MSLDLLSGSLVPLPMMQGPHYYRLFLVSYMPVRCGSDYLIHLSKACAIHQCIILIESGLGSASALFVLLVSKFAYKRM